jgi:hypothetical protein
MQVFAPTNCCRCRGCLLSMFIVSRFFIFLNKGGVETFLVGCKQHHWVSFLQGLGIRVRDVWSKILVGLNTL